MGTNCAPLVADLFLFCFERDFISAFLDLNLSIKNDTVSTKKQPRKCGDTDFPIISSG